MKAVSLSVIAGIAMLMTGCSNQKEVITGPPLSGKPFVTKYLVAKSDTRFENVQVLTNTAVGKVVILSDPSRASENVYYDPTSGDPEQIEKFLQLQEKNQDNKTHPMWFETENAEDVPYRYCFAQAMSGVDIICNRDYRAGYPAGVLLNDLFKIAVHDIAHFIKDYSKEAAWGPTYNYLNGEFQRVEGVLSQEYALPEWNSKERTLVSLIPALVTDVFPENGGNYSFTVTYRFVDGSSSSFTTPSVSLPAE